VVSPGVVWPHAELVWRYEAKETVYARNGVAYMKCARASGALREAPRIERGRCREGIGVADAAPAHVPRPQVPGDRGGSYAAQRESGLPRRHAEGCGNSDYRARGGPAPAAAAAPRQAAGWRLEQVKARDGGRGRRAASFVAYRGR